MPKVNFDNKKSNSGSNQKGAGRQTGKITELILKTGLIENKSQAIQVMIGIAITAFIASALFIFGLPGLPLGPYTDGPNEIKAPPRPSAQL